MLQAFLVLPGFAAAYLVAGQPSAAAPDRSTCWRPASPLVVSGGWYLLLVELWPASARPYIGGSQHDSIVELALGYNGLGRLTGDETGGLGNLNFDVGWGRLFGSGMGADIAWLLPAAVICLAARVRHHPARAADGSDAGGADPVGRLAGGHRGGVQLRERHRAPVLHRRARARDRRVRSASAQRCCGATAPTSVPRPRCRAPSSSPRSSRRCCWHGDSEWLPWLRAAVAVGGVGAAVLLLVVGSAAPARRPLGGGAWPSRRAWRRPRRIRSRRRRHRTAAPSRRSGPARAWLRRFRRVRAGCSTRRRQGPRCRRCWPPTPTTTPGPRPPSARTTRRATNWPAARR